jgi:hypothetical protein
MKNKKFFFLTGIMRCGNTVLTSLINQNPNLCISPNSIVPEIIFRLYNLKNDPIFDEQKDHKSYDSVIKSVLNNYYKDWKQDYIIERGPWGTPFNYEALKELGYLPSKFICLVRPIKEILASFIKVVKPTKFELPGFCDYLMHEAGPVGKSILGLNNLKEKEKDNLHIIEYHDLCKNPEKVLKNIYNFLEIEYYKEHKFTSLKQVDFSKGDQTTIRTDKVSLKKYNYDLWLPKEIIKKYENASVFTSSKNR